MDAQERLTNRRSKHVRTSNENKVVVRWATGGYKLPGSMNSHKGSNGTPARRRNVKQESREAVRKAGG